MSFSKTKIYNLALSALLLSREVDNVETSKDREVKILNVHYDTAIQSTLQDLDLDSTSEEVTLELLETLSEGPWTYVYKYPSDCSFFRRIKSGCEIDNRTSHIPKKVKMYKNQKVIFTNEVNAIAELIPEDVNLAHLGSMTALCIAYRLAFLSAPLIVGKGAKTLRRDILELYTLTKSDAQENDARENFNYETDWQRSEFVEVRLS